MKLLVMLGSSILAIIIGIILCMELSHCPHILRRWSKEALHRKYIPSGDISFRRNKIQGYGPGPHGSTVDASSVTSSDCILVGWGVYRFATEVDAEEQFQEWVKSASKIIDIRGSQSENKPERSVLQSAGFPSAGMQNFVILSKERDSKAISAIWSGSLEHAIMFEAQDKSGKIISDHKYRPRGTVSIGFLAEGLFFGCRG